MKEHNREFSENKKASRGSLTVETLLFLIPFLLAFATIINLSRFAMTEMIIHHAITQTAKEISAYSYVFTKTGITTKMKETYKKSEKFKEDITNTIDSVVDFGNSLGSGDIGEIQSAGEEAYGNIEAIASDPKQVVTGLLSVLKSGVTQAVTTYVTGALSKGSIEKQLALMGKDPDTFLKDLGVVDGMSGLDFSKSRWNLNSDGTITVVVTFKLKNNIFPMFDFGEKEYMLSASTLCW